MKRKQRKVLVLLILAVVIITYNQQRVQKTPNYPTNSSLREGANSPFPLTEVFNPDEEFKRLEKTILMAEAEDPETERAIAETREFFGDRPKNNTHSPSSDARLAHSTPPSTNNTAAPAERFYTVQDYDTLSKISKKFYGTSSKWKMILDANSSQISSAKHVKVGMKLVIPHLTSSTPSSTRIASNSNSSNSSGSTVVSSSQRTYEIQKNDSLYKISKKLFNTGNRWKDILEWNRNVIDDPKRLRPGTILVIK